MVRRATRRVRAVACAALLSVALLPVLPPDTHARETSPRARLHLVTFEALGTAVPRSGRSAAALVRQQDAALDLVDAPSPTYRWTTALSGVAVALTPEQVADLAVVPGIAGVEPGTVRPLAATGLRTAGGVVVPGGRGGRGVVVGVVDTGVWPESPVFAPSAGAGGRVPGFSGSCQPGEQWDSDVCQSKLVGARWFVEGFGRDRLASLEPLSARDVRGHGTQVASIAVGNSGVSTGLAGLPDRYSGAAPDARLAVYKACWSAPDPREDGCATADLVTAVDRAVADGVDVLNLSVQGGTETGAVEEALLGASEAGVLVVGAAGNDERAFAPAQPWVTSVGALAGTGGSGSVVLPGGRRLTGAMTVHRRVTGRLVLARRAAADGATRDQARTCAPGSLDAARAAGRVVVCERGGIGRLEKSAAVERADGVGMVLVNRARGGPAYDLHAVPTVHLRRAEGRSLLRWATRHPRAEVRLVPGARRTPGLRVPDWSAGGNPAGSVVKPDLVAPATGVLALTPPGAVGGGRWGLLSGTSAAAAQVTGAAAVLLSRHDWSAATVRSVLATSASPVAGGALRAGSGRLRLDAALRTRLALVTGPASHRRWLRGGRADVDAPSILLSGGRTTARRTVTNLAPRSRYWSAAVSGFRRHDVRVAPLALRLDPGERATFTVTVEGPRTPGALDDGAVTWRSPDGTRTRIPVVIGR